MNGLLTRLSFCMTALLFGFICLSGPTSGVAWAQPDITDPLQDLSIENPALEARAQALAQEVRCLVCQGESVAESGSGFAADMRAQIRQDVLAGKSDEEIRGFLLSRYGDVILFTPPFAVRTVFLWLAPLLLLLTGLFLTYRAIRKKGKA